MNTVSTCCCNQSDQSGMIQGNLVYQSAQIAKSVIAGEQNADIEIQTADGDKVTLSSDTKFESTAITYEKLGRKNSNFYQSRDHIISVNAESNIELTVEGTLDDQEKKEIKEVLKKLFEMVKGFITGETDAEELDGLAELTTISEVKAEFDNNINITGAAISSANHIIQTTAEQKPAVQDLETENHPLISDRVDKLTDRMIRVVEDSDIDPAKIMKRLSKLLSSFSKKFMNESPAKWQRMQLRQEILEDFVRKLKELSVDNQPEVINKEQADGEKTSNLFEPAIDETTPSISEFIVNVASQNFHFDFEYSVSDNG